MWARGGETQGPGLVDDLKTFGAPPEIIEQARAAEHAELVCEVWPENWAVVSVFLELSTQWSVGFGGALGLRYDSAILYMRARKIRNVSQMLDDLRIMEAEALRTLNEGGNATQH